MYRKIRILVFAKDAEEALETAREVACDKLGFSIKDRVFDYETALGGNKLGPSSRDMMRPLPPVLQVSTENFPTEDERGMEEVNSAIEANRCDFKWNMAVIRHFIENYSDDELFDEVECKGDELIEIEEDVIGFYEYLFRNCCEVVGGHSPMWGAHLFDFKGRAISSPSILEYFLGGFDIYPFYADLKGDDPDWGLHDQPLWVVAFISSIPE